MAITAKSFAIPSFDVISVIRLPSAGRWHSHCIIAELLILKTAVSPAEMTLSI
ncbi:hypothetical protein H7F10_12285 [Acidithiobacillus sp. HP-6]|nr:hypothetical protein [Acidithiobacillus sp. HP-6]